MLSIDAIDESVGNTPGSRLPFRRAERKHMKMYVVLRMVCLP